MTDLWYKKNKTRALQNIKRWQEANHEKVRQYKRNWFIKNPDYKREWKQKNQKIKRVINWLNNKKVQIVNSKNYGYCTNCGMKTHPKELFKYQRTFKCFECIADLIQAETKVSISKVICLECGREHRDNTHYGLCIDCFVVKRREKFLKLMD